MLVPTPDYYKYIIHSRSQTDPYQFLKYVAPPHAPPPSLPCAVVTESATSISTDEFMANICWNTPLKGTPICTDEILRNISDVNTIPGVVGMI